MALNPRPAIAQGVQIGAQTSETIGIAAGKKMQSIGMSISPKVEINDFRPAGAKYRTVHALGKEWSEISIEGRPTFDELSFLFCGLLKDVSPTTSDNTARTWTFEPSASAEDTVRTFTIEQGGTVRAHKAVGMRVNGATFTFDRNGVELSGDGFAQAISDGITMTTSVSSLPLVPIQGGDTGVFLDTGSGLLGTTRMNGVLKAEWSVTDRFTQLWTVNDTLDSYAAGLETEPSATLKLTVNADSEGMGLLSAMRDGSTRFVRIVNTSDTALAGQTSVYYRLQIDCAVQVAEEPPFSEVDDVFAVEWGFNIVTDATWNKTMSIVVVNKQTSL